MFSLRTIATLALLAGASLSHAAPDTNTLPDPLADKVIISGNVPDEATRAAILARVRELYGAGRVIDQMEVGGVSAPPNWSAYTASALTDSLTQVRHGQLRIDGTKVALQGVVTSAETRKQVATDIAKAFNETYTVDNALTVTPEPQAMIDDTLADRVVEFRSGSAKLTELGQKTLDEIAQVIIDLGYPPLQVVGHTDSLGNRLTNIGLSLARADSVKQYLIAKGVPDNTMTALGAGPDHPITTNDTPEGRAKNRRIEFRILK